MLWVITYKGFPATLEKLYEVEGTRILDDEKSSFLAANSKRSTIGRYIYHFGFTWKERPKGVECLCIEFFTLSFLQKANRKLRDRNQAAIEALRDEIDGGEECQARDSMISDVIHILRGE